MQDMTELILLYDLVVSRADPSDNPRLDELKSREVRMKQKIIATVREMHDEYSEAEYNDDIFTLIADWNDECCIDAFAKGVAFAMSFSEQAGRFKNTEYFL